MEKLQATILIDEKAILGEGPTWDEAEQKLYWVDIIGKKLHSYQPQNKKIKTRFLDQYLGAAVLRKRGGMILAMHHGLYEYDLQSEETTLITDPQKEENNTRFNDGKCDPEGRFWAGTMHVSAKPKKGEFYCLDTDMNLTTVRTDVTISNGLAWDTEKQLFYYIDTALKKVLVFDYDQTNGTITNERTAVDVDPNDGHPDGMTIDAEGMLWVAKFGGSKIVRYNPTSGEKIAEVSVPASQVTSCVFGGENLETLFITTAKDGLSDDQLKNEPFAGGVFSLKPGVRGSKTYYFKG